MAVDAAARKAIREATPEDARGGARTLVRVIGCGNPDAGDDAVGVTVARAVATRLAGRGGVEVVETTLGLRVLDLLEGAEALVVVDAVRTAGGHRRPGTIVRAEAGPFGLPADIGASLSSHGLGLGEAVGLAVALGRAPNLVFLGVEAGDFETGHPLSPSVGLALPDLVARTLAEVERLLAGVGSGGVGHG